MIFYGETAAIFLAPCLVAYLLSKPPRTPPHGPWGQVKSKGVWLFSGALLIAIWESYRSGGLGMNPAFDCAYVVGATVGWLVGSAGRARRHWWGEPRVPTQPQPAATLGAWVGRVFALCLATEVCGTALYFGASFKPGVRRFAEGIPWPTSDSKILVPLFVFAIGFVYGQVVTGALVKALERGVADWSPQRTLAYCASALPVAAGLLFVATDYPGIIGGLMLRAAVLVTAWVMTSGPPVGTLGLAKLLWARRPDPAAGNQHGWVEQSGRHRRQITG